MSTITELWLENRRGGKTIGIGEAAPRISFTAVGPGPFDLRFAHDDGRVEMTTVSDTQLVAWPFAPLSAREGGELRAGSTEDALSVRVETGLGDDWNVDFVSPSVEADHEGPRPAWLLRATFDLARVPGDIARARVYATAHGVYELELNGARVGDDVLAPGWTSYGHRIRYQTHDVTDGLVGGTNVIGAWLADGWYRGHIGFDGGLWNIYGTDVALLAQLEVTTTDGTMHHIPLEWAWSASPITAVGLYEGETFDARLLPRGWSTRSFDAAAWSPVQVLPRADFTARIESPTALPVQQVETIAPVSAERRPNGRIRLDFGQNISGVIRIRVRAEAGRTVRLHHAEVIENGELGTRPLRGATSIDTYTTRGGGEEVYTPRFTIHGFQYAELENWPGELTDGDVEAVVIHTSMRQTAWFESSHPGLNKLHSNVQWSMRDNFVDLPTDCPQRDERVGWTGDIQVFAPTALRLFAAQGTLTGWLRDLAFEQAEQGHVPQFVPWIECGFPNFPTAAWGDAAVVVPWEMYFADGDTRILAEQYASMCAWVDLVDNLTDNSGLWNSGFQLGDWLDPTAPPEDPGKSHTDKYLVATAYHVRTARILADTAALLGEEEDAQRYAAIADRATRAFQDEFISGSGRVVSDTPTSIAVALVFDLFESDAQAARAGRRLLELVEQGGFHISTGFVGTPIICDALVLAGSVDYAYHLLRQEELPSWLYPVSMGATTIWERWDSMLPDGNINPGDMTSFNHYALGAVASFLHQSVAGLASDAPGWERVRYQPRPGGGLTHASARYDSVRGTASIRWTRDGDALTIRVEVPAASTGVVVLPGSGREIEVGPGEHTFTESFRPASDDPAAPVVGWRKPEPVDA
ncbi:family 78 glycoside hydrolase catalytic domain [Microbacterium sp. KSW4-11]|uniref:alpha-L-rhamnosidase n=1 Tax=Microbacterium gawkjiense TaxID=3067309 RepID=A0ABU3G991_9MICO|nr:family 78 glycoside hydrolase catalytic domain [Microbacterium sp. KSW4-11]MDT3316377.1 family 78 glycoside hydrolase catalytic domain [Microbacterium sp. KSW4-11]